MSVSTSITAASQAGASRTRKVLFNSKPLAAAIGLEPMVNNGAIQNAMAKHAVPPDQLTLHADRGGPMKAKATALMLADPGLVNSHSRPHTSNDTNGPIN